MNNAPSTTPASSASRVTALRPPVQRMGFTLIEILVVISIIVILMGIMVAAFMNRQGPASATRITLAALKGAAVEYEAQTGQPATSRRNSPYHNDVDINYEDGQYVEPKSPAVQATIGGSTSGEEDTKQYSIERFVHQLMPNEITQKMITSLGKEVYGDSDGNRFADVVDGWGNKIIYYNPADDFDTTQNRNGARFLPTSRTPYFASAGEDGQWGDVTASEGSANKNASLDNVYSFDLVK